MSPCVSPMFICCSGDLVIHLLQGGHIRKISGWYARSFLLFGSLLETVFCSIYPYDIDPSLLSLS